MSVEKLEEIQKLEKFKTMPGMNTDTWSSHLELSVGIGAQCSKGSLNLGGKNLASVNLSSVTDGHHRNLHSVVVKLSLCVQSAERKLPEE